MKQLMITLFLMTGLVLTQQSYAVHPGKATTSDATMAAGQLTVNDFLAMDFKSYRDAEGKKLNWAKRIVLKGAQKNFAKKVKQGKLEGTANFQESASAVNRANRTGRFSLIFAALGLVMLFIPPIALLGFALGTAGFILGLIGLSKDEDPTMAIIGTVVGGIILLVFLLAVAVIASWGSWF